MENIEVNDQLVVTNLDEDELVYKVVGKHISTKGEILLWLCLETDEQSDGYNDTCVIQQKPSGFYCVLADERADLQISSLKKYKS